MLSVNRLELESRVDWLVREVNHDMREGRVLLAKYNLGRASAFATLLEVMGSSRHRATVALLDNSYHAEWVEVERAIEAWRAGRKAEALLPEAGK